MRPSPDWLDAQYNNRLLVPDFARHLTQWQRDSEQARQNAGVLDLSYGSGPGETLDIFPSTQANAPVLVFIHGGYWRSLDKSDHSFVAPAFVEAGACVVVVNYALCPSVTVPTIALQLVKALVWVSRHIHHWGADPRNVHVQGHSAGGHLAAMMLACQWQQADPDGPAARVRTALSISGLHELETLRHVPFLAADLRLTAADARRCSPAWMPAPAHGQCVCVAGGDESGEFVRQAHLLQQAWGRRRVPEVAILPGLNHFSILGDYARAGTPLHQRALQCLGLA